MRSHPRPSARRIARQALASGAVLVVLAAAGCSKAEPGVVAYVGDRSITQARLDQAVSGATKALGGQPVSSEAIINVLIHGELSDEVANARNLGLTDSARDALIKSSDLAPLLTVPDAVPLAHDIADEQLVAKDLGQDYLTEIAKIPVKLNPRFGVLNPTDQTLVPDASGSLAKALATPEPAPAPTQ
jgi:hypothetical protein